MRLAAVLAVLALPAAAGADGGLVRLSQAAGPFTITVFTAPTPLRAGAIDVSVLVQRAGGGEVVDDAAVTVTLRGGSGATITAAATRAQATNKLLYAALLDLPAAGAWEVAVEVQARGATAAVAFPVTAAPPLPPWRAYWPYFLLPFAGIGLYALHQWLVLRRGPRVSPPAPRP